MSTKIITIDAPRLGHTGYTLPMGPKDTDLPIQIRQLYTPPRSQLFTTICLKIHAALEEAGISYRTNRIIFGTFPETQTEVIAVDVSFRTQQGANIYRQLMELQGCMPIQGPLQKLQKTVPPAPAP